MLTPSRLGPLAVALTACGPPAPSPVTPAPRPPVRAVAPGLGIDRPHAIATWITYELLACAEDRGEERCRPVPDITTDETVARCRQGCDDTIAEMTRQTTTEAIALCVDRYVRDWGERGRASARCSIKPSRPYASRVDRLACVSACLDQGEAKLSALHSAPRQGTP